MIGRPVRAWLEPLVGHAADRSRLLRPVAFVAVTNSAEVGAIGGAIALFSLAAMFLAAIIRPPAYGTSLLRAGVFRSAKPNEMAHAGIGRTFQNIRLFANMTALENVLVGMHLKLRANAADALFSTPRARREENQGASGGRTSCWTSSASGAR